jgi:hypothetical protein
MAFVGTGEYKTDSDTDGSTAAKDSLIKNTKILHINVESIDFFIFFFFIKKREKEGKKKRFKTNIKNDRTQAIMSSFFVMLLKPWKHAQSSVMPKEKSICEDNCLVVLKHPGAWIFSLEICAVDCK